MSPTKLALLKQRSAASTKASRSKTPAHLPGGRESARLVKDQVIQIRTTAETKAMIARAAELDGRSLSDYVLRVAEREATDAMLDQRRWTLNQKDFEALLDLLDNPQPVDDATRARFGRKPLWDES